MATEIEPASSEVSTGDVDTISITNSFVLFWNDLVTKKFNTAPSMVIIVQRTINSNEILRL